MNGGRTWLEDHTWGAEEGQGSLWEVEVYEVHLLEYQEVLQWDLQWEEEEEAELDKVSIADILWIQQIS